MKNPEPTVAPGNGPVTRPEAVEEQIRCRAYQLYEERGKLDGYDVEDWLRAEAEILTHKVMRKAA
jgi:hypothetical protein